MEFEVIIKCIRITYLILSSINIFSLAVALDEDFYSTVKEVVHARHLKGNSVFLES